MDYLPLNEEVVQEGVEARAEQEVVGAEAIRINRRKRSKKPLQKTKPRNENSQRKKHQLPEERKRNQA